VPHVASETPQETVVWTLDISVIHGSGYGHRISARVLGRHGGWIAVGSWSWSAGAIPRSLVLDIQARVSAVIGEHLTTRYGLQVDFPGMGGRPSPPPATA